jgi:hypothetical protein
MAGDDESIGGLEEGLSGAYKKLQDMIDSNTTMEGIMREVRKTEDSYSNIARIMGVGRESASSIKQSMTDAYAAVASVGGTWQDIEDAQKSLIETTGRNILMTADYIDDLSAAATVGGTSIETLTKGFVDAGYSTYNIGEEMNKVFNTARSLGVSIKAVTEGVLSNMDALDSHNFKGGVDGLAKMAATSASLRVDMSTIMRTVDKAFDPEGAINMAAAFQRLGVSQSELLDPISLMNMSMNDPEQFTKSIGQMGASLTELDEKGNIRIAPGSIRRMKQLADATGMSTEEFAKMSKASAELDIKMQKISFPDFATEEQKTMIANISQMKDGKIGINVDGEMKDVNTVLEQFRGDQEGLKKFLEASRPKTTEELLKESNTYAKNTANATQALAGRTGLAIAGTKTADKLLDAESQIVTGLAKTFDKSLDIKSIRDGFDKNVGGITEALAKLVTGEGSFDDVAKAFKSSVEGVTKGVKDVTSNIAKYGTEEEQKIINGDNVYAKAIVKVLDKFVEYSAKVEKIDGSKLTEEKTELKSVTPEEKSTLKSINPAQSMDILKDISVNSGISQKELTRMLDVESKTNVSGDLVLKLEVNAPPGMDTKQLEQMLKDPAVREAVIKTIHSAKTNDGAKGYMGRK